MAWTITNITSGTSTSNLSSYSTASITPNANKLHFVTIVSKETTGDPPTVPTVSGNGLTFTAVANVKYVASGTDHLITIVRGVGASPTTGALTIDFAGQTQQLCNWSVDELDGADTSDPVVQTGTDSTTDGTQEGTVSITLNGFASGSAVFMGVGTDRSRDVAPETGWTELVDIDNGEGPTLQTGYKASEDTSPTATISGNAYFGAIAIEVKEAGGAAGGGEMTPNKFWGPAI